MKSQAALDESFWSDLAAMITDYLACALWSSNDPETEEPLDDTYDLEAIDADWAKQAQKDCYQFLTDNEMDIGIVCMILSDASHGGNDYSLGHVGHDLWLTRNGHGTGFWDRKVGDKVADDALVRLSDASRALGLKDLLPIGGGELG